MQIHLHLPTTTTTGKCESDNNINISLIDKDGAIDDNNNNGAITFVIHNTEVYNALERTNKFWKNLVNNDSASANWNGSHLRVTLVEKAKYVKSLVFHRLFLDDWEPFLQLLKEFGVNMIEKLELKCCRITERGALLLGNICLQTRQTSTPMTNSSNENSFFSIKSLYMYEMKGSTAWIDGFLQNKTITHLDLWHMPVLYSAINFIYNSPRLKEANLLHLTTENWNCCHWRATRGKEGEKYEFNLFNFNIRDTIETDDDSFNRKEEHEQEAEAEKEEESILHLDLETLTIKFSYREHFPLSLCRGLGSILGRSTNLCRLKLENVKGDLSYDFLKDAIHCNRLDLCWSDFDPKILSSLIKGKGDDNCCVGGKLKHLRLYLPSDTSIPVIDELIDLSSLLESFEIECNRCGTINTLCREIAHNNNKGPKRLKIVVHDANLNEIATRLASGIVGNDKIEQLEIHAREIGDHGVNDDNIGPQEDLVNAMAKMPRLSSWKIHVEESLDQQMIQQWIEWIVQNQVDSNWNIRKIDPPFDYDQDMKDMLIFNQHWRKLFSRHDDLSSGIWSPALSRIETIGLMFRVIREVPSLFQQAVVAADTASDRTIT